ncbi:MAG TPA: hypothetical protein VJ622_16765 [Acidimicrobiia bacterium]|nr:hypothetical protein [Acidimicrobiia bacterium]HMC79280.1 hypothetical protein [Acidimicrobiia bacterium]
MSSAGLAVPVFIRRRIALAAAEVVASLAWDPAAVLGLAEPPPGDGRLLVPLRARFAGVWFDRSAAVGFGPIVEEDDGTPVMPVWWEAAEQRWLFPTFDGGLEVRPVGNGTELRLEGHYRPPLGAAGVLVNRAVLNRAATASLEAFLDRLCGRLVDRPVPA